VRIILGDFDADMAKKVFCEVSPGIHYIIFIDRSQHTRPAMSQVRGQLLITILRLRCVNTKRFVPVFRL